MDWQCSIPDLLGMHWQMAQLQRLQALQRLIQATPTVMLHVALPIHSSFSLVSVSGVEGSMQSPRTQEHCRGSELTPWNASWITMNSSSWQSEKSRRGTPTTLKHLLVVRVSAGRSLSDKIQEIKLRSFHKKESCVRISLLMKYFKISSLMLLQRGRTKFVRLLSLCLHHQDMPYLIIAKACNIIFIERIQL